MKLNFGIFFCECVSKRVYGHMGENVFGQVVGWLVYGVFLEEKERWWL